jgi:hypothetical protein
VPAAEDVLDQEVARLANRVAHWTPSRWTASSVRRGDTRAGVMYALVQRLADAAADAEGQPRRTVPRLANDLALPDQLRVVAADLIGARPEPAVLTELAQAVAATNP